MHEILAPELNFTVRNDNFLTIIAAVSQLIFTHLCCCSRADSMSFWFAVTSPDDTAQQCRSLFMAKWSPAYLQHINSLQIYHVPKYNINGLADLSLKASFCIFLDGHITCHHFFLLPSPNRLYCFTLTDVQTACVHFAQINENYLLLYLVLECILILGDVRR